MGWFGCGCGLGGEGGAGGALLAGTSSRNSMKSFLPLRKEKEEICWQQRLLIISFQGSKFSCSYPGK